MPARHGRYGWIRMSSNTAVVSTPAWWLVTARPMFAAEALESDTSPRRRQMTRSVEYHVLNALMPDDGLSDRRMRSQTGAEPPMITTFALDPPVALRYCIAIPFPGVTTASACVEAAVRTSRIITPALAHASVLPIRRTRAVICRLLPSAADRNRKLSLVPQISVPDA